MCMVENIIRKEFTGASAVEPAAVVGHTLPRRRLHLMLPGAETPTAEIIALRPRRPLVTRGACVIASAKKIRPSRTRCVRRPADQLAAILAERRGRIRQSLGEAAPGSQRLTHSMPPERMDLSRLHEMRATLYPAVDPAADAHERRMRIIARSMNAALAVTALPVGLAMLAHSARRGADLRFSARVTGLTGLFLAALQLGLTEKIAALAI